MKFPQKQSRGLHLNALAYAKTCTVDLGWVDISRVISVVSGPKFTKKIFIQCEINCA